MTAQNENIYGLLEQLERALDKGFPLLSNYLVVVKRDTIEYLLDRIYQSLPTEVKEARTLLKHRDEIQHEAQQRAERLIVDAKNEAARLLSKSELLEKTKRDCKKFEEQFLIEFENVKRKAFEEAESIKSQAREDVNKTRQVANVFAEQILNNLDQNLNQMQQLVKNAQLQLEKQRTNVSEAEYNANPQ